MLSFDHGNAPTQIQADALLCAESIQCQLHVTTLKGWRIKETLKHSDLLSCGKA